MAGPDLFDVDALMGDDDGVARHLRVLRTLLERDYLGNARWEDVLADLARMVRTAVGARHAMVALWTGEAWRATTHEGEVVEGESITAHASRSVLDRVRHQGRPVRTTTDAAFQHDSASIRAHGVDAVVAAPLFWWDVTEEAPVRRFGGCVYAHRTADQAPFEARDVDIVLDLARLAQPTLNMLRRLQVVERELDTLRRATVPSLGLGDYTSADPAFVEKVISPLERVSRADRVGILILGPTGAGKTHLAAAYHRACPRAEGPFVVLDCAQVTSATTLTAELFGYAPDSGYANAPAKGRPGKAALADGGTLFIDEVGTLPPELQQKLLQLLESGRFSPLGGSAERQVDLQVIAATNEPLARRVREGRFREDLYWRLTDVTIELPSLDERAADIPALAEGFVAKAKARLGRSDVEGFTPAAMAKLVGHPWSLAGNIRGLERTVLRSVLMAPEGARRVDADDIQLQTLVAAPAHAAAAPTAPVVQARSRDALPDDAELRRVVEAIREHGYATKAAEALDMSYRQLTWRLHKHGLSVRDVL